MKQLLVLLILIWVTGCTPTPMAKAKQDFACKDKGGVYEYSARFIHVQCRDGTYTEWPDHILTENYYPKPE